MDILRTLNSILTPGVSPVNRARPAVPVTETQAGQRTFAQTLEEAAGDDPSIAPFGVSGRRTLPSRPSTPDTPPRPQIEGLAPGTANPKGVFTSPGGPTILPENPAVDHPALDRPIDQLHVEIGDTLQSIVTKETETLTKPEPMLPPAAEPPKASAPPPPPILWTPRLLVPSGATGPGIQTTQAAVDESLATKFAQYTDPKANGVSDIGPEGRLFVDAVKKGYVPNTPEGLGTMLAYLSMGDYRADGSLTGRDPAISQYFNNWFSSPHTANV